MNYFPQPYRKDQETPWTRHLSERDKRLTGCDMILAVRIFDTFFIAHNILLHFYIFVHAIFISIHLLKKKKKIYYFLLPTLKY